MCFYFGVVAAYKYQCHLMLAVMKVEIVFAFESSVPCVVGWVVLDGPCPFLSCEAFKVPLQRVNFGQEIM